MSLIDVIFLGAITFLGIKTWDARKENKLRKPVQFVNGLRKEWR